MLLAAMAMPAARGDTELAGRSWCPGPSALSRLSATLPHTAARLRAGGELVVVAIGSSSTAGVGASSPARGYPGELQTMLAARFKPAAVRVLNKGVSGDTFPMMLERFDRDVLAFHPDLVIWQLGTNELIREQGVTQDEPFIRRGVERLKAAGADVILMNPQYAPAVLRDPDCPAMVRLLDEVGREEQVPVFDRFDVMRDWVVGGRVPMTTIVSPDGLHMNDVSYRCIGDLLADAISVDVDRGGR